MASRKRRRAAGRHAASSGKGVVCSHRDEDFLPFLIPGSLDCSDPLSLWCCLTLRHSSGLQCFRPSKSASSDDFTPHMSPCSSPMPAEGETGETAGEGNEKACDIDVPGHTDNERCFRSHISLGCDGSSGTPAAVLSLPQSTLIWVWGGGTWKCVGCAPTARMAKLLTTASTVPRLAALQTVAMSTGAHSGSSAPRGFIRFAALSFDDRQSPLLVDVPRVSLSPARRKRRSTRRHSGSASHSDAQATEGTPCIEASWLSRLPIPPRAAGVCALTIVSDAATDADVVVFAFRLPEATVLCYALDASWTSVTSVTQLLFPPGVVSGTECVSSLKRVPGSPGCVVGLVASTSRPHTVVAALVWFLPRKRQQRLAPRAVLRFRHSDPMVTGLVPSTQLDDKRDRPHREAPRQAPATCRVSSPIVSSPAANIQAVTAVGERDHTVSPTHVAADASRGVVCVKSAPTPGTGGSAATSPAPLSTSHADSSPALHHKRSHRSQSRRSHGCDNCGALSSPSWREGQVGGTLFRLCQKCQDCGLLPPRRIAKDETALGSCASIRTLPLPASLPAGCWSADGALELEEAKVDTTLSASVQVSHGLSVVDVSVSILCLSSDKLKVVAVAGMALVPGTSLELERAPLLRVALAAAAADPSPSVDPLVLPFATISKECGGMKVEASWLQCVATVGEVGVPCCQTWRSVCCTAEAAAAISCCGVVALWNATGAQTGLLLDQVQQSGNCANAQCEARCITCTCHHHNAVAFHPTLPMLASTGRGPPPLPTTCGGGGQDSSGADQDQQHVHVFVPAG